jgi:hypothetical protein
MRYQQLHREPVVEDPATRPVAGYREPAYREPAYQEVGYAETAPTADRGLRVFQILTAAAGAVLFVFGVLGAFRVDFGDNFLRTSGEVAGIGFSAAGALAALLLGAGIMAASLADQDRGTSAFLGILTLLVGIGGLIAEDQAPRDFTVDHQATTLFIVVGAAAFVLSLIPWWTHRRQVTTVVRR